MSALNGLRVVLVAAVLFTALGCHGLYNALRMIATAVPVAAVVTSHDIKRHRSGSDDEDSYTPVVTFRFAFEGRFVTASNIYPGYQSSYGSRGVAHMELNEWPLGTTVTAYVPPHDASEAFLRRVPSGINLLLVFLPIGILVGSIMYLVQVDRLYVYERGLAFNVLLPLAVFIVLGGASLGWTFVVSGDGAVKAALWISTVVLAFAAPLWIHMANSGELVEIAPDDLS